MQATSYQFNNDWITSENELLEWMNFRQKLLPATLGSPGWWEYVRFIETKLHEFGAKDIHRNCWMQDCWYIPENPQYWKLVCEGDEMKVAYYGAYSGTTGRTPIDAPLAFCDPLNPPNSLQGKIAVIPVMPHPEPPYTDYIENFIAIDNPYQTGYLRNFSFPDYDFMLDEENALPIGEKLSKQVTTAYDTWWQTQQALQNLAISKGALGLIIVYDMCFTRAHGHYAFPLEEAYNCPTLIFDRDEGQRLISFAKQEKKATLLLDAEMKSQEVYQIIAYLPGRNYGTERDEQIALTTHTDGPALVQEDGPFAVLSILKYFSNIPQENRNRTLLLFFDCRHLLPGHEWASYQIDFFYRNPEKLKKIVATLHLEMMGEMEYAEFDGQLKPTGRPDITYLWTRNNPLLIEFAKEALQHHKPARMPIMVPERRGKHGGEQAPWWGVNLIGDSEKFIEDPRTVTLNIPGYGIGSFGTSQFNATLGMESWSAEQHRKQTLVMAELGYHLMVADLSQLQSLGRQT